MSSFLLYLLQSLSPFGVPVAVCEDHTIRIGSVRCDTPRSPITSTNLLPPPPPPPYVIEDEETTTISNGF